MRATAAMGVEKLMRGFVGNGETNVELLTTGEVLIKAELAGYPSASLLSCSVPASGGSGAIVV